MKITIEMENLNSIIEQAVERNTSEVIEEFVKHQTKDILEKNYSAMIEEEVTKRMEEYISTYIENYQIAMGGNGLSDATIQYYTPREYINKTIDDIFRDKKFTTVEENCYGDKCKKEISFEQFVKEHLNPTAQIKRHMESLAKGVKSDVNSLLKNEYDKALRDALSGVVMDVIMQNDAFKNINNNIKRLGD